MLSVNHRFLICHVCIDQSPMRCFYIDQWAEWWSTFPIDPIVFCKHLFDGTIMHIVRELCFKCTLCTTLWHIHALNVYAHYFTSPFSTLNPVMFSNTFSSKFGIDLIVSLASVDNLFHQFAHASL